MSELDALCDLLDDSETEEEISTVSPKEIVETPVLDPEETELLAMMAKVEEMKSKIASKKKSISDTDLFQVPMTESKSPIKTNPFVEPPNKSIILHPSTPQWGPALPIKSTRRIVGEEKAALLSSIEKRKTDVDLVKSDLADSSDEEEKANPMETSLNPYGQSIKKSIAKKPQQTFNKIQGSVMNISKPSTNKSLPSNMMVEKHTKIRIANPLVNQTQLDFQFASRKLIQMHRIKEALLRKEFENKDWATVGVIYYKSTQTSKNGNPYSLWKMSDLKGVPDPISVTVLLFGRSNTVHFKMPKNKVLGLLNPKVMEDKGGAGTITLSIDHPDKVLEMGEAIDVGKCKSIKGDGTGCTNLVNLSACEYCAFHVKKAYKSVSSKRSEIQSSFSGTDGGSRSRIMSKIAPKGEIFGGGQILNSNNTPRVMGKASYKQVTKDSKALKSLGVVTSSPVQPPSTQNVASTTRLINKANSINHMTEKEKTVVKEMLNKGINEEFGNKLLDPTPGSKALLKHLAKEEEVKKEASSPKPVKSAKDLILEHKNKLNHEIEVQRRIAERKKVSGFKPTLGKGFESGGCISFDVSSSSKLKAISALKGKHISKSNPNAVKRKKNNLKAQESARKKVALALEEPEEKKIIESSSKTVLKGLNGQVMDPKKLEALKKVKSVNSCLAEEEENLEREKYFDVLEKKDSMEEKMASITSVDVKAVTCSECNYTAFTQSELCKESGHRVHVVKTKKRFFECVKCSNRTLSLDKYPKSTCSKCGASSWKKCGMIKEKMAKLEHEKLLVRGLEQKFVHSNVSSSKLDLDSTI